MEAAALFRSGKGLPNYWKHVHVSPTSIINIHHVSWQYNHSSLVHIGPYIPANCTFLIFFKLHLLYTISFFFIFILFILFLVVFVIHWHESAIDIHVFIYHFWWQNWGTEKWSNLPKVTQLTGRSWIGKARLLLFRIPFGILYTAEYGITP